MFLPVIQNTLNPFAGIVERMINAFASSLAWLIVVIAAAIPWVGLFLLVSWLCLKYLRWVLKRKREAKLKPNHL